MSVFVCVPRNQVNILATLPELSRSGEVCPNVVTRRRNIRSLERCCTNDSTAWKYNNNYAMLHMCYVYL